MAQPYNLTFLHSNFYIKENIDLICRMTPDIKNFIFIGDERQNNQTYNMVIKQELKKEPSRHQLSIHIAPEDANQSFAGHPLHC